MTKHTATPSPALPKLKPLVASLFTWVQRPGALALALGAMPALALANMPTGGKVVAGAATITNPDGSHTVVEQSSDKAVVNWQSFSIGQGGHVQFVQRDANSVTLNRVVGSAPSTILGNLSANGQIFLVNQNGIFFGHSAQVDVAGIVATTLDIKDEDFMRGDYHFARGANAPARAAVINEGALNANGGYVVLAGDYVANKGIVQAQLGTALLASGDALTLQTAGSSLISYQVDKATVAHLAGVENSGQILANGGRVIMTADVAQDLASTVVNNSGLVQARSAVEKNGAIYFEGNGGSVANSGTLDARAQAGAHGGQVAIHSSGDIAHTAGSKIDVSGAATGVSNAGTVDTWADGANRYQEGASIAARGGLEGGNGGQVELSGNQVVNRSTVDLRAPKGELGTLTLDPTAITIADGAGADAGDQSTIYEQNLEAQLKLGNVNLLATGQDASITVATLSDGVLDGSNNGSGGSLSLRAEGSGNPAVSFIDKTNTIKVDKAISITTGDVEAAAGGTVDVGHLKAGTRIDVDSGSVKAASLAVEKTIATVSDNSYAINARARTGNLAVAGDVKLDVTNTEVGAVSSAVSLRSDSGDVAIGGNVSANATGKGYYFYNWTTAGNNATTYHGQQPWTLASQGDHAVSATLNIQAAGRVSAADINVVATDTNTAFDSSAGGYWQTASATQHNFWRPTASAAAGAIQAGADVAIGGKTTVRADGYAVNDYTETESYRTMVNNFYYTSANQTVRTQGCLGYSNGVCTGYGYNGSYVYTDNRMKGGATGNYIWQFGDYTSSLPGSANDSPNYSRTTDSSNGSTTTGMRYTGARGMSATLNLTAGGSVSMNGMDVHANNRSATGNGSFTDANWGQQDTAAGLNGTASSFTSNNREVDYDDRFSTRYTAGGTVASATITAGDNASVSLAGASHDVVAEIAGMNPGATYQADASLSISAGSAGGARGSGLITIANGLNLVGAKNGDLNLNIRNYDGAIQAGGAPIVVTNGNSGADARATISADNAALHLDSLAVSGGRSAYVNASGSSVLIDGATGARVTGDNSTGDAHILVNASGDITTGDLLASSAHKLQTRVSDYYDNGYDYRIEGGKALIDVRSTAGNVAVQGDALASGYTSAYINLNAYGAGATLSTGTGNGAAKTVRASSAGETFLSNSYTRYVSVPTYVADVTLGSNGAMDIGTHVEATLANRNGAASVSVATTGGVDATIAQAAGTRILASGSTGLATIQAGAGAAYGAAIDMNGNIAAQGSTGSAIVTVNAASGSVHGFGATSRDTVASVTLNARDADGSLAVDGAGAISGTGNAYNSVALAVNAAGALDAGAMNATVTNTNTGDSAGATAHLSSGNGGGLRVGSLRVTGAKTATAMANSSGSLDAVGNVAATASAASGDALVSMSATGNLGTGADGSAIATANGSGGNASVNLTAGSNIAIDGDLGANATGNGNANIVATSVAANSVLAQGAGSSITANGAQSGSITLRAGSANTGAFNLEGDVRARATGGAAVVNVIGSGGAVHGFGAVSTGAQSVVDINALNGNLALTGDASLSGASATTLNAAASGSLSVSGNLAAANSGANAMAQVNLNALGGTLTIENGGSAAASATGVNGRADLNATASGAMSVDGDLRASSATGDAGVDLLTLNGAAATITQGQDSTVAASGKNAAVFVNAGSANPNAASAAAYALGGALQASSTAGSASITINGSGGSVHDFSATSSNSNASVTMNTLAPNSTLVLDGAGSVSTNVNASNGALLIASATTLDAGAASLAVENRSAGANASARASLDAVDLTVGSVAVSGNAATLSASAANSLAVRGALSATASGAAGAAQANVSSEGTLAVAASGSVTATASRNLQAGLASADVNLSGARGVTLDGDLNATAGGFARIDAAAAHGNLALGGNQSAMADRSAGIVNRALDGGLTQAAGSTLHSGATEGSASIALTGKDAMRLAGKLTAAATANGGSTGIHTGSATVGIATTGGVQSSITQDAGSTIEAVGQATRLSVNAGALNPLADIASAAAFSLNGSLRAIDDIGGSSLDIAGASGNVHDFTVSAADASASATISALAGDLVLDGAGSVGANGSATLLAEAAGALDARNARLTVASTGSDAMDYADASLAAFGGDLHLGQAAVGANGGSAGLFASASGALAVSGSASARSTAGDATVDLSTSGGLASTITQAAGSTVLADGVNAAAKFHAANPKGGDYAAVHLGGDVQARATTGSADIVITGASMTLNDFSAASVGGDAFVAIETLAAGGHVVLNGSGSALGATAAALNATSSGNIDVNGRQSVHASGNGGDARLVLDAAGSATVAAGGVVNVTGASAGMDIDAGRNVVVAGSLNAVGGNASIALLADNGNVALNGQLAAQGAERGAIGVRADNGSLTQAGILHSGASNGVAQVDLSSKGAMAINGQLSAAATLDGAVDGAHTGAALISMTTNGGTSASIAQSAGSTIAAVGRAARLNIAAGNSSPFESTTRAAAFELDGSLRVIDGIGGASLDIAGASGRVHDFTVGAADATASASIAAVNGDLVLNGAGIVAASSGRGTGASLEVSASGALDTSAAVLSVANTGTADSPVAQAVLQAGSNAVLGKIGVTSTGASALAVKAGGTVDVTTAITASATGSARMQLSGDAGMKVNGQLDASGADAGIDLLSQSGGIALNTSLTAVGAEQATAGVRAKGGTLVQAAGTVIRAGAKGGAAQVDLSSKGPMTVNGNLIAAATADGSVDGAHTGAALVGLTTTGGAGAAIVQDKASTITAVGRAARLAINAGSSTPAENAASAAAFKLDGTLRAIDALGGSSLQLAGASGSVHDITVTAADATARADIAAVNGDLVLTGTATVSGNADEGDGASLRLSASGSLDTTGVALKVANVHSGDAAGAQAVLLASTGAARLGVAKVTAQGGGTASFAATAGTTLVATTKLDAENLGLGTAPGNALVKLNTTGKTGVPSTVTQNSGATITARTAGNAGNAGVDIQAGNCCNAAVMLNDTVKATVDGGTGNATIAVRAETVTVKDLTANVLAAGKGNTMLSLAAPTEVKLAGTIDSQAAAATARAGVQLVTDKLTEGATFKLSKGNGHVQMSAFNTGKIIGVHSDRDFDETADVNFNLLTLKKFMTQGAELTFGGEFDRSAWLDPVTGEVCLPGMEAWASQLQHTGAIHVSGNGRLNLGDVTMVFDTTGITTYHDPKLSAWSVPTGRVATLVVPPSNVDRYLDRTDNTLQNMNQVLQESSTTRSAGAPATGQGAPRGTQIGSKLFMDNNGVNMAGNAPAEGSQADTQGPDSERLDNGDSTEQ